MSGARPGELSWSPDLHVQFARRSALLTRATRAAAGAALAAVAGWVIGLSPDWHALALFGAAVIAAAWPPRAGVDAAFAAIAEQAGLAYQTHVEHGGRDDPHGLLAAAAVQARLSVRDVTPPRQGAWWLPLAALAVAVWLLAGVVGGPGGWMSPTPTTTGLPDGSPTPASPPPLVSEPELDEPLPEAETAEAPEPPSPPAEQRPDTGGPGAVGEDAPDGEAEGLEREALERFLESLRERPSMTEAELAAAERDREAGEADADSPMAELQGEPELGPQDGQRTPAERPDDFDPETVTGLPEEVAAGDSPSEEQEGEVPPEHGEAGEGDAGTFQEAEADGGLGGDETAEEAELDPGTGEDDLGVDRGTAQDETAIDAGEGDEAGRGAGLPTGGLDDVPDPGGELEQLTGILGQGPESLGGRVRLPGRDSDVELTPSALERYERAVEQAVTDGAVPVEYQEVIRNYFR